jgi:hypothetical protein
MKLPRSISVLLLVVLLGTAMPPAAGQSEPDWASLPYFRHDYGGWMRIWTNESTFDKGERMINASTVFDPYPGPTIEEQSAEFQVLWAEKCAPKKAQTFKTTREIYLMGQAETLQASLGAFSDSLPDGKPNPIERVELVVNGTTVYEVTATKGSPIPYDAAQRTIADISDAPLKYGLNTISVIGHKKKTKKSLGWCTGDNYFGVLGEVYGEFLADTSTMDNATGTASDAYAFNITVTNDGPSDLIPTTAFSSRFSVSAVSGLSQVTDVEVFGIEGCDPPGPISNGSKQGLGRGCPLPRMEPGASFTVNVIVRWNDPPLGSTTDISYTALGYGESESPEMANNGRTFTVTVVEQ